MNDTVVIYDRIRENLGKFNQRNFDETANVSVNEISRTIITSLTTLLALVSIFILGR